MFHLQNYKTMKANVQISAVKKEFKNGQQGWQVFVEGMEGKLRCEMNFRDALRAIRYSFLLAKKLNLRINEVQLAALSLDYKQSKSAVEQAQVAEVATEVAQEVAAEAEQGEPSDKKSEAAHEFVSCSQMYKFRDEHPDAVVIGRKNEVCEMFGEDAKACAADSYKCYEEDAIKAAEILRLTDIVEEDKITIASFPYHALDSYLPRLIRAGHRIAICDQLESPKPKKQAQMELFTNA